MVVVTMAYNGRWWDTIVRSLTSGAHRVLAKANTILSWGRATAF